MVEDIVGCKWSLRILQLISEGTDRPSGMLRACPGLSAKVMNQRLAKMQRFGIAARTVTGSKPPLRVVYSLTDFGARFVGVLDQIRRLQTSLDASDSTPVERR